MEKISIPEVNVSNESKKLADYIGTIDGFEIQKTYDSYDHMGALVVDGILQASLKYETVVRPRAEKVLNDYSEAKTTSEFMELVHSENINEVLRWKDDRKPGYILGMLQFLKDKGIETVPELSDWLEDDENMEEFIKENKGVGKITGEYFKILSGGSSVKADRHVKTFLKEAGVQFSSEDDAKDIVVEAANMMGVAPEVLDHSIWKYVSERS